MELDPFLMETVIPFLFILAIVYGGLEVSNVFKKNAVKAIISLVVAFFGITSPMVVGVIVRFMPYAAIFFMVFFLIGFLMTFFKEEGKEKKDYPLIIAFLALLLIFLSSQENLNIISFQDQNFLATIILLVILLIIYGGYKAKND
jgi:hypothetical protein